MRESPALPLIDLLQRKGAVVSYADPHVPVLDVDGERLTAVEPTPDAVSAADCVLVVTAHAAVDHAALAEHAGLVFDTRSTVPAGPGVHWL